MSTPEGERRYVYAGETPEERRERMLRIEKRMLELPKLPWWHEARYIALRLLYWGCFIWVIDLCNGRLLEDWREYRDAMRD